MIIRVVSLGVVWKFFNLYVLLYFGGLVIPNNIPHNVCQLYTMRLLVLGSA